MAARAWRNGVWVYRDDNAGPARVRGPIPPPAVTAEDVAHPLLERYSAHSMRAILASDPNAAPVILAAIESGIAEATPTALAMIRDAADKAKPE